MTITAHTMVKNEARFVWYSVMSVIDHVDTYLLWDTGSTDGTIDILKEIKKLKGNKVDFRQINQSSISDFTEARRKMLEATKTDWFVMVDADEIWWDDSIRLLVDTINEEGKKLESIVVPTINLVGDMFHYQEEAAGNYHLAGRVGHLNLRGINRKIPGLSSNKPHGTWGWTDGDGKMIQDRSQNKIRYIEAPYLHATFLERSGFGEGDRLTPKRAKKLKHEIGIEFPSDYFFPEAFFRPRPEIVPSPWETMDSAFKMRAYIETPLRKLKRRLLPRTVGY